MPGIEPELAGKFVVQESRFNADPGIMAGDGIEAEQGAQQADELLRLLVSGRFAGEQQSRPRQQLRPEPAEIAGGKLMEDQIAADDVVRAVARKTAQVRANPPVGSRPGVGSGPEIESIDPPAAPLEPEGQLARARTEFEDAFGRPDLGPQQAGQPAMVAHQEVDEPQIAPVLKRGRMIAGQRVEQFGLDEAGRHTSRCGGRRKRQTAARRSGEAGRKNAHPTRQGVCPAFNFGA